MNKEKLACMMLGAFSKDFSKMLKGFGRGELVTGRLRQLEAFIAINVGTNYIFSL